VEGNMEQIMQVVCVGLSVIAPPILAIIVCRAVVRNRIPGSHEQRLAMLTIAVLAAVRGSGYDKPVEVLFKRLGEIIANIGVAIISVVILIPIFKGGYKLYQKRQRQKVMDIELTRKVEMEEQRRHRIEQGMMILAKLDEGQRNIKVKQEELWAKVVSIQEDQEQEAKAMVEILEQLKNTVDESASKIDVFLEKIEQRDEELPAEGQVDGGVEQKKLGQKRLEPVSNVARWDILH